MSGELPSRRRAWAAAVAWSVCCLGVLGGLPAWLVSTWGWPPPTVGLGLHLGALPASYGPGAGIGLVDVLVWVAWAGVVWFAFALSVEAAQAVALKTPRRLAGLGPAQTLAARAIGAILLVRALSGAAPAPAPASPASLVLDHRDSTTASEPVVMDATSAAAPDGSAPAPPVPSSLGPLPGDPGSTYVVRRGDTLWGIAAAQLGNPLRWPEVAALNYGRAQPDGRALTSAHWIYPGWVLHLPAETVPPTVRPPSAAPAIRAPVPPPASPPARGPAPAASSPVVPGGPPGPARPSSEVPSHPAPHEEGDSSPEGHHQATSNPVDRSVWVDAGVVAALAVSLVEVWRRVQQRHRRRGRRIRLPEGPAAEAESRLRRAATPEIAERIDTMLRGLAGTLSSSGAPVPTPAVLTLGQEFAEMAVGAEAGAPPAGVAGWAGHWLLDDRLAPAERVAHPWPALAPIGVQDDRLVLVNLEAAGTLSLLGEPEVVEQVLRALATQLSTAPWAAGAELVLVGFGAELRPALRARLAGSLTEVLAEVEARRGESDRLLSDSGQPSLSGARLADGGDAWAPLVVVSAEAPSPQAAARLADTARPGGPVAVVAPGLAGANWRLDLSGAEAVLDPLGIRLHPSRIGEEEWSDLGELFAVAADLDDVAPEDDTSPAPLAETSPPIPEISPEAEEVLDLRDSDATAADAPVEAEAGAVLPPEPEVEVLVLGPVDLRGNPVEPQRPKYTEVILRHAMAERALPTDQLVTDLWAGSAARSTVDTNVSKAREVLGFRPDGTPRLSRAQGWGERALHESVRTDWWRFRFFAKQGSTPALRMALELIRGRPFEDFKADWPGRIYVPNMVSEIVDVAEALALRALDAGDPATARWAARQGLKVAEYDERLWRCLLQAAHDEAGVRAMEAIFDECAAVLEATVEPFDSLQPETIELYLRLGGRRRSQRQERAPVG